MAELKKVLPEAKVEMAKKRQKLIVQDQELLKHQKEMRSKQPDAAKKN